MVYLHTMIQNNFSITEKQFTFITAESERQDVSKSSIVRKALDWYMETYPPRVEVSKVKPEKKQP